MTEETQVKRTVPEMVEAMKRLYIEIQSITEEIDSIKTEAKERGFNAALMAKVSKAMADSKTDDILDKNDEFASLVETVRNS